MTLKFNVSFFNLNIKRKMGGIIICVFDATLRNLRYFLILSFFCFVSVQQQQQKNIKIKIIN